MIIYNINTHNGNKWIGLNEIWKINSHAICPKIAKVLDTAIFF